MTVSMSVKMTRLAPSRGPEATATAAPAGPPADPTKPATDPATPTAAATPQQMEAIALARRQARKIRRAAAVAAVSGWTLMVFAGLTLLCGVFSVSALLPGAVMGILAWRELRGSRGLRMFDLSAPHRLGWNQIALGVLIITCGIWGVLSALTGASPYEAQLAAGGPVAEALRPIDRLQRVLTILFYAVVIVVSLLTQGSLSAYYFTRRRHLSVYLSRTPPWIVDMLRVAGS